MADDNTQVSEITNDTTNTTLQTTAPDGKLENNAYDSQELYTQSSDTEPSDKPDDVPSEAEQQSAEPHQNTEDTQTQQDDVKTIEEKNKEYEAKLKEYELRKQEQDMLRQRLGLREDTSEEDLAAVNIEQQIINRGKTAYLDLCNRYGVDADPDRIAQTIEDLKNSDPRKGYALEKEMEALYNTVNAQKQQVTRYQVDNSLQRFVKENSELLNLAPSISNTLNEVAKANMDNPNIYQVLNETKNYLQAILTEGFTLGQQYSANAEAKKDTSGVEGSITKVQNQTTPTNTGTFTAEQIGRMSQSEFEKNYDTIMRLYAEGKIQ